MESKSLVQIVNQVTALEMLLIESGGQITEEIEKALLVRETHLPEKIDGYALTVERFDMISAHYRQQANFYLDLAKSAENVVDRCKDNLKNAMKEMNVTELVGNDVKYKLSPTNPTVLVEDDSQVEDAYKIKEVLVKVDKKKIAEDLKLGVPVKGARMQENFRLTKSANRGK